jgi:hypothetical protein
MSESSSQEPSSVRDKGWMRMRSIMDFGMGTLWVAMGFFMIFIRHFSDDLAARYDDPTMKWFGGTCIVYGMFRWYRGFKKNYWKER